MEKLILATQSSHFYGSYADTTCGTSESYWTSRLRYTKGNRQDPAQYIIFLPFGNFKELKGEVAKDGTVTITADFV